jgi:aminoglycoside phosphotransferase (APT) family kinase protein
MEDTRCLVHGDYSAKNVLLRDGQPVLLDYEVAHFGNPCFDLGFVLPDYLCMALNWPERGRAYLAAARALWDAYRGAIRLPPESRARAGHHLAAVWLARVDGKSPFEYFTDEDRRHVVRRIAGAALLEPHTGISSLIRAVEAELP